MFLDRRGEWGCACIYIGLYPGVQTYARHIQVCMKASQEFSRLPSVFRHRDHNCAENVLGRSRVSWALCPGQAVPRARHGWQ